MTKREQHRFVRALLNSIHRDIRVAIRTNVIPRSWDGIELREYIAEKGRGAARLPFFSSDRRPGEVRITTSFLRA